MMLTITELYWRKKVVKKVQTTNTPQTLTRTMSFLILKAAQSTKKSTQELSLLRALFSNAGTMRNTLESKRIRLTL